jgi:periplasmic protein TonB
MLLDRLQSGFLLFETPQKLMRVELSLQQRIYLLWTFRNFRQLSVPLLNAREQALVNSLFRNDADDVTDSYDPEFVIGVVEKFVPSKAPSHIQTIHTALASEHSEISPQAESVPSPSPSLPRFAWPKLAPFKLAKSKLATAVGALFLAVVCAGAWHRMQATPGSAASNQPELEQANLVAPPPAIAPTTSEAVIPSNDASQAEPQAVPQTTPQPALQKAEPAINSAGFEIAAATPAPSPAPKRESRVHDATATPSLPVSVPIPIPIEDSGIQATRPPLHFVYPVVSNARAHGVVALTAGVDSDGTVRTVKIVSGNRALAAAAVRAVRQWRYRPYLNEGQPVATATNIVISFLSSDAISMSFPPSIPDAR